MADPASEEVILTIPQPFANHNGGQLAFGPDNNLYIGMGDGGSGGDPLNNGQSPGTLLGRSCGSTSSPGARPYGIPPTNPLRRAIAGYRPEIWALGLRNPWRFSFDRGTGDLYIGDVGQGNFEEIDFQPAGDPGGGTTAGTSWRAAVATIPDRRLQPQPALPSRSPCTTTRSGAP